MDLRVAPQPTAFSQGIDQTQVGDHGAHELPHTPNPFMISRLFVSDSRGSNKRRGTYITCKMSQLEEASIRDFTEVTELV